MATLAIYVDLRADGPTAATRHALAEARRIADALGASCVAVVGCDLPGLRRIERLTDALGRAGADRVLLSHYMDPESLPLWSNLGAPLEAVAAQLRPRLFLFPAGTSAAQLAAPLAMAMRAPFFPDATVVLTAAEDASGPLRLVRRRADWSGTEALDVRSLSVPVVAVLAAGPPDIDAPGEKADLESPRGPVPESTSPRIDVLSVRADEHDADPSAETVVWLLEPGTGRRPAGDAVPDALVLRGGPDPPPSPNLDVLCPRRLCLAGSGGLPLPPPIKLAADARVLLAGPRRPSLLHFPAAFLRTADPDRAWLRDQLTPILTRPADEPPRR